MAVTNFNAGGHKLKRYLSVRARLVLLALILVAPLMLDRVRVLENTRTAEIKAATKELSDIARRGAEAQNSLIDSVDGLLKTIAYIHTVNERQGKPCSVVQSGMVMRFDWIKNLSIIGPKGIAECSTMQRLVGYDVSDRPYYQKAVATRQLVVSDYVVGKAKDEPLILAAYPTDPANMSTTSVIVASVNLSWLGQLVTNLGTRSGAEMLLIDGNGVVLAAHGSDEDKIGKPYNDKALLDAVNARESGSYTGRDLEGRRRLISFIRIPSSDSHLIVSADEKATLAAIDRDIMTAYLQIGIVAMIVLFGAWLVSERLIIRPIKGITTMATRFGHGDLAVRTTRDGLPAEFRPLATAFNVMAAQLAARDAELRASNSRLTVLASVDVVSGIANRRAFESRLEIEWLKAEQTDASLALAMIDVDHFKLFNDTYGHPQGDACLRMIGDALTGLANEVGGFPARYGGEEFLLLMPDCDSAAAAQIAERIRSAVQSLAIPHSASTYGCVTVSVGFATAMPREGGEPAGLVSAADGGLYAAKRRGRNTAVEHGSIEMMEQPSETV